MAKHLSPIAYRLSPILVFVGLLAASLLLAIPALSRMAYLLGYPYAHDGLEGTLLYEARLLRSGQALYQPLERYRFVSAPYPPVSYLALALFDLLSGPHVFWSGRLLFFLCAMGVCMLIALIIRQTTASWPIALFAAALFLSVPPLQLWATRIKPDLLALFFTSLGLYLGTRSFLQTQPAPGQIPKTGSIGLPRSLGLAALAFALAFYTKQTAVAGALAVGLALLAADWRDWRGGADRRLYVWKFPVQRRTLGFASLYLSLTLGTWLLLDVITAGQYSLHVWWSGDRSQWWTFSLLSKIIGLLGFWWPQILLAALIVPLSINRRMLFIPACYLLVAPLTLLGAGETGANHNHLLETHLALTLAGCSALGVALNLRGRGSGIGGQRSGVRGRGSGDEEPRQPGSVQAWGSRLRSIIAVLTLILAGMQVWQAQQPPDWYTGELAPTDPPERYLAFIRATPGEILADDTGLLFQAGRELRYDDPSTMGPAAKIGKWDQSGLVEEITQKKFSAIMIPVNVERSDIDPAGRWTPEMLAAIKANYQLKFRDTIYVYVPR